MFRFKSGVQFWGPNILEFDDSWLWMVKDFFFYCLALEDEGSTSLRNVGNQAQSHPSRPELCATPLWAPQTSLCDLLGILCTRLTFKIFPLSRLDIDMDGDMRSAYKIFVVDWCFSRFPQVKLRILLKCWRLSESTFSSSLFPFISV